MCNKSSGKIAPIQTNDEWLIILDKKGRLFQEIMVKDKDQAERIALCISVFAPSQYRDHEYYFKSKTSTANLKQ